MYSLVSMYCIYACAIRWAFFFLFDSWTDTLNGAFKCTRLSILLSFCIFLTRKWSRRLVLVFPHTHTHLYAYAYAYATHYHIENVIIYNNSQCAVFLSGWWPLIWSGSNFGAFLNSQSCVSSRRFIWSKNVMALEHFYFHCVINNYYFIQTRNIDALLARNLGLHTRHITAYYCMFNPIYSYNSILVIIFHDLYNAS